jgi:hypothetical protein
MLGVCRVQFSTVDDRFVFPQNAAQFLLKSCCLSTKLHISLIISIRHIYFYYLAFGASFAFWEANFHKIKGRETLSSSQ